MCELKFSLVIPTFNRKEFVSETIKSALAQEKPFSEIIVVDDGSTDGTEDLIKSEFPVVRYFKTANYGVQHARNFGASMAKSDWLTFCDSDDLLSSSYLETANSFLVKNPRIGLVFSNFQIFKNGENGECSGQEGEIQAQAEFLVSGARYTGGYYFEIPDLVRRLLRFQGFMASGTSIRREAFLKIGGYNVEFRKILSEDFDFVLRALSRYECGVSKSALVKIRKHGSNQSGNAVRQKIGECIVLDTFKKNEPFSTYYRYDIEQSIIHRLRAGIDLAYESCEFDYLKTMTLLLPIKGFTPKILVKRWIAGLPQNYRKRVYLMIEKAYEYKPK